MDAPSPAARAVLRKCNMIPAVPWIVGLLDWSVLDELESPRADVKARFRRVVELNQGYGLERVREPHVKHVEGPLWEMRMSGRDGMARALYVAAKGRRVVVVRVFVRRTEKTPRREIELALERVKEVTGKRSG